MPGSRLSAVALLPNQLGSVSGAVTPDLASGTYCFINATGNVTINNPANPPGPGAEFVLDFTQDATGGRTITWGSQFSGALQKPNPTPNSETIFRFVQIGIQAGTGIGAVIWWCVDVTSVRASWTNVALGTNVAAVAGFYVPSVSVDRTLTARMRGAIQASVALAQYALLFTIPTWATPPATPAACSAGSVTGAGITMDVQINSQVIVMNTAGIANGNIVYLDGMTWPLS